MHFNVCMHILSIPVVVVVVYTIIGSDVCDFGGRIHTILLQQQANH